MRLVLTHSGMHFAPKRQARYTPMPATPPWLVVSLLRAYPNGQDPPLRSGEKPHLLHFGRPTFSLTPSLNLLSQAKPLDTPPSVSKFKTKSGVVEVWYNEPYGN